ncbi:MAG: hypothetical protein DLM73_03025 [Chthoniobacterales bacterium]|nr:MAG: hypothetical protein DLM73_03025 [Chthoniobacterales bacterium]
MNLFTFIITLLFIGLAFTWVCPFLMGPFQPTAGDPLTVSFRCDTFEQASAGLPESNHLWITIEPQRLASHEQRGPESAPARANLPRTVGVPLMRRR